MKPELSGYVLQSSSIVAKNIALQIFYTDRTSWKLSLVVIF